MQFYFFSRVLTFMKGRYNVNIPKTGFFLPKIQLTVHDHSSKTYNTSTHTTASAAMIVCPESVHQIFYPWSLTTKNAELALRIGVVLHGFR